MTGQRESTMFKAECLKHVRFPTQNDLREIEYLETLFKEEKKQRPLVMVHKCQQTRPPHQATR